MRKVGMHADVKACKNDENKKELTRFRKENKQLTEENRSLKERVDVLTEENISLRERVDVLTEENMLLAADGSKKKE